MTLDALLVEAARFFVLWRDRDMALAPHPRRTAAGIVFAEDRSGGEYVLVESSTNEAAFGVWLLSSEGERHWLAPSAPELFKQIALGFTVADLIVKRETPSERPSPGVIRWLSAKK